MITYDTFLISVEPFWPRSSRDDKAHSGELREVRRARDAVESLANLIESKEGADAAEMMNRFIRFMIMSSVSRFFHRARRSTLHSRKGLTQQCVCWSKDVLLPPAT